MLIVIGALLLALAVVIGLFFYRNAHPHDEAQLAAAVAAGFSEKRAVLSDGSVISYGEGPDHGPALLLIHGQGGDWSDYAAVLPRLSKTHHVFAVDCYGHGHSTHDRTLYRCVKNGEALAEFLQTTVQAPCIVSGHSSGGILAAWLAANAPEQVSGVVLEDPFFFRVLPSEMQAGAGCAAWKDAFVVRHDFLCQTAETDFLAYYINSSYFMKFFGRLQPKVLQAVRKRIERHPDKPVTVFWLPFPLLRTIRLLNFDLWFSEAFYTGSWFEGMDQEATLRGIRCPAVYLKALTRYGKDGVLYAANSDEDARKVAASVDRCEVLTIKSGHDIHYEHPQFFIAAVEKIDRQLKG